MSANVGGTARLAPTSLRKVCASLIASAGTAEIMTSQKSGLGSSFAEKLLRQTPEYENGFPRPNSAIMPASNVSATRRVDLVPTSFCKYLALRLSLSCYDKSVARIRHSGGRHKGNPDFLICLIRCWTNRRPSRRRDPRAPAHPTSTWLGFSTLVKNRRG
jgi:hypothetical protein